MDTNCHFLPQNPRERLKEVLDTIKPDDVRQRYTCHLHRVTQSIKEHRIIIISGASSNHYGELQVR